MTEHPLTRKQAGEKIFQAIKADLKKRGYNLARLAPEYTIGKSTIYAFRRGVWTEESLASLPFSVSYKICNLQIGESSGEIEPNPPKSGRPKKSK